MLARTLECQTVWAKRNETSATIQSQWRFDRTLGKNSLTDNCSLNQQSTRNIRYMDWKRASKRAREWVKMDSSSCEYSSYMLMYVRKMNEKNKPCVMQFCNETSCCANIYSLVATYDYIGCEKSAQTPHIAFLTEKKGKHHKFTLTLMMHCIQTPICWTGKQVCPIHIHAFAKLYKYMQRTNTQIAVMHTRTQPFAHPPSQQSKS